MLCRFGVNFSAKLQGNKSFYISQIIKRTRHVSVVRVAFLAVRNGGVKTFNRMLVSTLASRDPSIRRMDVAQSQIIVGVGQYGLGLLQNVSRLLHISFLKVKPALENSHDCSHGLIAQF